jgi:hypothetical protein
LQDVFLPRPARLLAASACLFCALAAPIHAEQLVLVDTEAFADVPMGHPYHAVIRWQRMRGVVHGYERASMFRPEDPITRVEFAALLSKAGDAAGASRKSLFDVYVRPFLRSRAAQEAPVTVREALRLTAVFHGTDDVVPRSGADADSPLSRKDAALLFWLHEAAGPSEACSDAEALHFMTPYPPFCRRVNGTPAR